MKCNVWSLAVWYDIYGSLSVEGLIVSSGYADCLLASSQRNLYDIYLKVWLEANLSPYKYPNILKSSHSSYLPAYKHGADRVFRNVGI